MVSVRHDLWSELFCEQWKSQQFFRKWKRYESPNNTGSLKEGGSGLWSYVRHRFCSFRETVFNWEGIAADLD